MLKVLIIEDEQGAYDNLSRFLKRIDPNIQILAWLKSVDTSVTWLQENKLPDLIFQDIQLSDGNSFDIFKEVEVNCPIIFTTAYDQYALKAFELHSIDYLLKPISKARLEKALDKFRQIHQSTSNNPLQDLSAITQLIQQAQQKTEYKDRFLVKKASQLISIPVEKIAYFYVDEITVLVTLDKKKFTVNYSLDKLESLLNPKDFFRLNRKVIAQYPAIDHSVRYSDTKLKVNLKPNPPFEIIISKEKAAKFKAWLE